MGDYIPKLKGKHFIVGITGGIAAYKAAILIRLLVKQGAEVQVLMTEHAKAFITPLTVATLSKRPVLTEFFNPENGQWNSHVDIGTQADGFIIAPATANTMAKAANGIADNLLLTTYLSARCPIFWAPAMDLDMFKHPATQENIEILRKRGDQFIDPTAGELASGLEGKGRMAEPENILQAVLNKFTQNQKLSGKQVMITAGPTREPIDPVRYIGNHSSGKMGFALAEEAAERGAQVQLISGPVSLSAKHPNIHLISVNTADEMHQAAEKIFPKTDIAIFAAAVADFKPKTAAKSKLKKDRLSKQIELSPNIDIAKTLGKNKPDNTITVGFALETDNELKNAEEKLKKKNFDLIVLNSLQDKGAGFAHDTNKISVLDKNNNIEHYELKTKAEVACDIWTEISKLLK
jgi:phosphopantothenoylcysteine decarboxylase / phosphopantothenate---cysteine ligase